jgi:hypothetical protein
MPTTAHKVLHFNLCKKQKLLAHRLRPQEIELSEKQKNDAGRPLRLVEIPKFYAQKVAGQQLF